MLKIVASIGLLVLSGLAEASPVYILNLAQWSGPKDGARVLRMDGVNAAIRDLDSRPHGRLLLRYPGGDEGSLWVEELRAWLLALGVDPGHIELRPGSPAPDVIEMEVLSGTEVE
jgi:hypothetical protein